MKADTRSAESKGQEQILSKEAEHAEHVLDMHGLSKSVDNVTAVANAPCADSFHSRIQKFLQPSFAQPCSPPPLCVSAAEASKKNERITSFAKTLAGTKEIINSDREQSPLNASVFDMYPARYI